MNTFADSIRARVGDEKEGLRFEGRSWTWDEIVGEAATRAALLQSYSPGDGRTQRHVGVLLQNVPDFVFWLLAIGLSGDVIVGINPTRRGTALAHDIEHTDCDLLVTEPLYDKEIADIELPFSRENVLDVESAEYAQKLHEHAGAPVPGPMEDPEGIFLLLFSSGSTGAPKAVICTHKWLGGLTDRMTERISLRRDSVTYLCLPLFHGHGIMMNLATATHVGATVAMVRKFSASGFTPDIKKHGVTYFNYVGKVLSYILDREPDGQEWDNSLEVAFGTEASPAESEEFRERFQCEVREGYGASEGVIRIVPVPGAPRESLGLPPEGIEAQIRDPETNEECPRARFDGAGRILNAEQATGEIVAVGRGASFEGYYNNPEAMAERLRFGGEDFWTGDLGYRDDAGYFYFAGRDSDWVRVDGENFGVAPVERILGRYEQFSAVHAFGIADSKSGDQLMCGVTLKAGETFDPHAFESFLDEQSDLGTKWRPAFVRVLKTVPVTANGKVDKAPLRAAAWQADSVWWSPPRSRTYEVFTAEDADRLRREFVDAGRQNFAPLEPDQLKV